MICVRHKSGMTSVKIQYVERRRQNVPERPIFLAASRETLTGIHCDQTMLKGRN